MKVPSQVRNKSLLTLLLPGVTGCLLAGSALARNPAVLCGPISANGDAFQAHLDELREVVHLQVDELNEVGATPSGTRPYVVSVSLVDLSTQEGSYGRQTTATLHAVVEDKESGAILGGVRGRATAATEASEPVLAARTALRLAADRTFSEVTLLAQRP